MEGQPRQGVAEEIVEKFKEAKDLVELKAGFSIGDEKALKAITAKLTNDEVFYKAASTKIKVYVKEHTGATEAIVKYITKGQGNRF